MIYRRKTADCYIFSTWPPLKTPAFIWQVYILVKNRPFEVVELWSYVTISSVYFHRGNLSLSSNSFAFNISLIISLSTFQVYHNTLHVSAVTSSSSFSFILISKGKTSNQVDFLRSRDNTTSCTISEFNVWSPLKVSEKYRNYDLRT